MAERKYNGRKRGRGSDPEEVPPTQSIWSRCHAPHTTPTMSPVARTPWRRRSVGMANPVQPTSSSTGQPAVMPASRMAALLSAVNIGEVSESAKSTPLPASEPAAARRCTSVHPRATGAAARAVRGDLLFPRGGRSTEGRRPRVRKHRRGNERQERVELISGARKAAWTDHEDEAAPRDCECEGESTSIPGAWW